MARDFNTIYGRKLLRKLSKEIERLEVRRTIAGLRAALRQLEGPRKAAKSGARRAIRSKPA